MQKYGGTFVLKIFDIFTEPTIDFLYLLSSLYKNVFIMKPETSRIANSEKYIIWLWCYLLSDKCMYSYRYNTATPFFYLRFF